MKNSKLIITAILDSVGVAIYIFLVALVMNNGDKIFGAVDNETFAPVAFLLLFICSALITGGLVLGKPIMLYADGQKKEGIKLLLYTGASLFVLMILTFLTLILLK
jgi:hypothetical protein